MADHRGSGRRRQWSQPDAPDMNLQQMAESIEINESLRISGPEARTTFRRSAERSYEDVTDTTIASEHTAVSSRDNITRLELDLLRDSILELELDPALLHQDSSSSSRARTEPSVILEGDSEDDEEYSEAGPGNSPFTLFSPSELIPCFVESVILGIHNHGGAQVEDEFIELSASEEVSPVYSSAASSSFRIMSAEPPGRRTSAPARPLSGAPVRPKSRQEPTRDSKEDVADVLKALSAENKAVVRSSQTSQAPSRPPLASSSSPVVASVRPPNRPAPIRVAPSPVKPKPLARLESTAGLSASPEEGVETPTSATIKKISSRLARLDPSKQRVLQQVLDKLEKAEASGNINVSAMFSSLTKPSLGLRLGATGGLRGAPSPARASASPSPLKRQEPVNPGQEVVIRILTSHNGGRDVGLTEVELFDAEGKRIELAPDDVVLRSGNKASAVAESSTLGRIVSGRTRTTSEHHMWLGRLPASSCGLEVALRTRQGSPPAARMAVWNFNKSMQELGKGVREMQVYVDGDLTWQGNIARGCGNQTFDYSTKIALLDVPEPSPDSKPCPGEGKGALEPGLAALGAPAKAVGDLSNEELLEELKRRSVPIPAAEREQNPEGPRDGAGRGAGQSGRAVAVEQLKPPQLNESKGITMMEAASVAKPPSDGSPAQRPANKSKLDGLRSRLSARRGHGAVPAKAQPDGCASSDVASQGIALLPHEETALEPVKATAAALKPEPAPLEPQADPAGDNSAPVWLQGATRKTSKSREGPIAGRRKVDETEEFVRERRRPVNVSPESPAAMAPAPLAAESPRPISGRRSRPLQTKLGDEADADSSAGRRHELSGLEASLDSLAFFTKNQAGRLERSIIGREKLVGASRLKETTEDVDALINAELKGMDDDEALIHDELQNLFAEDQHQAQLAEGNDAQGDKPGFVIPTLPSGRVLELTIFTTWGDPHYVGMCGIEMFDALGNLVSVSQPAKQVVAEPASINELPDYKSDPRTPDKLLDGVNMTCDDMHVWLAPFNRGTPNKVTVSLDRHIELGMLRLWNYNKSRIHSQRGARKIHVTLDGKLIFAGEVTRAPGSMAEAPEFAECILFTEAEGPLSAIDDHDVKYHHQAALEAGKRAESPPELGQSTSDPSALEIVTNDTDDPLGLAGAAVGSDGRPMTSAIHVPQPAAPRSAALRSVAEEAEGAEGRDPPRMFSAPGLKGRELRAVVLDTWGDPYYMGLTGLQVLGSGGKPLHLIPSSLDACPRDLNAIPGYSGDDRVLGKLLDGETQTCNDVHMWLAPMKMSTLSGGPVSVDDPNGWLSIKLGDAPVEVTGLRIWNYNKSLEDTARGIKAVQLFLDGKPLSPPGGHLIAKAPGKDDFDFGQFIPLHPGLLEGGTGSPEGMGTSLYSAGMEASAWIGAMEDPAAALRVWSTAHRSKNHCGMVRQDFDTPLLPCGFVLKILLLNSWGDPHYVGLTGIQIVDAVQGPIQIRPDCVTAAPRSVADLPGMARDVRLPARLVDSPNSGKPSHSWLAPVAQGGANAINSITIALDRPVMLAALHFWNYAKTPQRGAQEVEVYLDDLMVFKGYVRPAPHGVQGQWQHSVLFHNDADFVQAERAAAYSHLAMMEREGPIVLVNERQFVSSIKANAAYIEPGDRPTTSVVD